LALRLVGFRICRGYWTSFSRQPAGSSCDCGLIFRV
jgi:hypothetical protein